MLLVAFGSWGLWKRRMASAGLLAGALIFACAIVTDQLYRYHEPIITGFFAETAGILILLLMAGVMRRDDWEALRERAALRERRDLLEARIDFQVKAAEAERRCTEQVRTMHHDMQGHLTLLAGYLKADKAEEAQRRLEELLKSDGAEDVHPVSYTGHRLIDDVLTTKLAEAERMEWRADALGDSLPIRDQDLMRVLLNWKHWNRWSRWNAN